MTFFTPLNSLNTVMFIKNLGVALIPCHDRHKRFHQSQIYINVEYCKRRRLFYPTISLFCRVAASTTFVLCKCDYTVVLTTQASFLDVIINTEGCNDLVDVVTVKVTRTTHIK